MRKGVVKRPPFYVIVNECKCAQEGVDTMIDTNELIIRPAIADDVLKIADVEEKCFPAAEAASAKRFFERFIAFPECFFVAVKDGKIVGHINGCVTSSTTIVDAMYFNTALHEPDGPWQTVFGIAVLPEYQRQGIATELMNRLKEDAIKRGKSGIILTCKEDKIGFYEGLGFVKEGVSQSSHGQARWYDMILKFS